MIAMRPIVLAELSARLARDHPRAPLHITADDHGEQHSSSAPTTPARL